MLPFDLMRAYLFLDFFYYSVHMIIQQHHNYPADQFIFVQHYGMQLVLCTNAEIEKLIKASFGFMHNYAIAGKLRKVALDVICAVTGDELERWQFTVMNTLQEFDYEKTLKEEIQCFANLLDSSSEPQHPVWYGFSIEAD